MPVFRYQAVDKRGRNLSGLMPAHDESNLDLRLKSAGLWLTEAAVERAGTATDAVSKSELFFLRLSGKRRRRELIDFCTLMTFQIRVGVTIVRALDVACTDCKDPKFQRILVGVQGQIESGLQFHEAIARYPAVFTPHFVNVIRAGELSSKLPETFEDLKKYLEWVDQMVAEVRQATLYPAIVIVVVLAFVMFLFTFTIPKFAELLDKLNVKRPLLTDIIFTAGDIARATWWIWLTVFLLLLIGIPLGRRFSTRFALAVDHLKLRLPIFGELNLMLATSRFAHNLAILYRSGIPILEALKLCQRGLIGNAVVENAVVEVTEDIKAGSTISEAMHRQPVFSALLLRMVGVGEATGNFDHALENVSDYYNQVIPRRIKSVFTVLEPALMLFLIFLVGAIALSIYMPILALMGAVK